MIYMDTNGHDAVDAPSQSGRNSGDVPLWKIVRRWAFVVLFVAPIYALIVVLLLRSGFFKFSAPINDNQYKVLWTFVATALGTAATVIGLLLTQSHNRRTLAFQRDVENRKLLAEAEAERRQKLDTVVKGLELVSSSEGKYAVLARVAGSLAALVHLGHPVIAMRALSAAWRDGSVDLATAVWLINEVLEHGSPASQLEACRLLFRHAGTMCDKDDDHAGDFEWPEALNTTWPADVPKAGRFEILFAIVEVVLSREKRWWGRYRDGWAVVLLDEAMKKDPDPVLRDCACHLAGALIESYDDTQDIWLPWRDGHKDLTAIREDVRAHQGCGRTTEEDKTSGG
jgi:hypothetical protein